MTANAAVFIRLISESFKKILPRKQKLQPYSDPCNINRTLQIYHITQSNFIFYYKICLSQGFVYNLT